MPRVEHARNGVRKPPCRARSRKTTPRSGGPAGRVLAACAPNCAPVWLALLLCCAGSCRGAEQPGVQRAAVAAAASPTTQTLRPATRVVPAAPAVPLPPAPDGPALDLLEYLGALQHDEQGWYGAEDINDGTALPAPAAARATERGEESKP